MWIDRLTTGEQLALAVNIRWLLTSRSRHLREGTRTMADITPQADARGRRRLDRVGVTCAGLHEGIERVFVTVIKEKGYFS